MKHRNVRRVDHHHFHGYCVSVKRAGVRRQRNVSDKSSGGRRAALKRALSIRDQWEDQLPPPVKVHGKTGNATGIVG